MFGPIQFFIKDDGGEKRLKEIDLEEVKELLYFTATIAWDHHYELEQGLSEEKSTHIELRKTKTRIQAFRDRDGLKLGTLRTTKKFNSVFNGRDSIGVDAKMQRGEEGLYIKTYWAEVGKVVGRLYMTEKEHKDLAQKCQSRILGWGENHRWARWIRSTTISKEGALLKL